MGIKKNISKLLDAKPKIDSWLKSTPTTPHMGQVKFIEDFRLK
jgi:hypothetical protein